jgi:hypothetical protein
VKTLTGRTFHGDDPNDKHWTVPITALPSLLYGPLADSVCVDYDALVAYDRTQEPLRKQYRRLLATLEGEPSPVLLEIIERYG